MKDAGIILNSLAQNKFTLNISFSLNDFPVLRSIFPQNLTKLSFYVTKVVDFDISVAELCTHN